MAVLTEWLRPRSEVGEREARGTSPILFRMFVLMFAQLAAILAACFLLDRDPVFVPRVYLGLDFHHVYQAARDFVAHTDPYASTWFVTPPSSISYGLLVSWMNFRWTAVVVFAADMIIFFYALGLFAQQVGLTRENRLALIGTACLFYPTYYLLSRENIEFAMFGLMVLAFRSKSAWVRSLALAASIGTKLYSGLLAIVMLRKKQGMVPALAGLFFVLMQLPFLRTVPGFLNSLDARSHLFSPAENLSPAAIAHFFLGERSGAWKLVFLAFWAGTLIFKIARDRDSDLSTNWPVYAPWMMSFAVQIYPYTGILSLCLLALISSQCQMRRITKSEMVVVAGIALIGFQAAAWSAIFELPPLHYVTSLGTLLTILGACGLPAYPSDVIRAEGIERSATLELSAQ